MLKFILKNDLQGLLGHAPTDAEYKSAIQYIEDNKEHIKIIDDIQLTLADWRSDCCMKCEFCGDYFLVEELDERVQHWGWEDTVRVCSERCWDEYCEEHNPIDYTRPRRAID